MLKDRVGTQSQVLNTQVTCWAGVDSAVRRRGVEGFEVLSERILLGALDREGLGIRQGDRTCVAQGDLVLAVGWEGIVVAAEARRRCGAGGEEVQGHHFDGAVRVANDLTVLHQSVEDAAVLINNRRTDDALALAGDVAVHVEGLGLLGGVVAVGNAADLGELAWRRAGCDGCNAVLEDPFQLGGRDGNDGEVVVEAQRVGDVELGDVAGLLTGRDVSSRRELRGAAASRGERADRVADAAAVLDRDRDRLVELLGVPDVGVRREVAEVGLLGADLAAAAFEVDRRPAEDVAILLEDDIGDAEGLLDAVVVGVEALDDLSDEEALAAGGEGGGGRAVELRHRGVVHRHRAAVLGGDRVADDVAGIVEGDGELADIGVFRGRIDQCQGLSGGVGEELRIGAARNVARQQPVVAVGQQGVRAAADQHVDVAQERRQGLLIGELLKVGADDDLVQARIGREHAVDLGVDLLGEQRDVVGSAEAVHRDVAERRNQRIDLSGGADEGDPLTVLGDDGRLGDLVRTCAGLGRGRTGLCEV